MDASKLTNGSRDEVLANRSAPAPKSVQASAVRSEARKVDKRSTGKKAKTEASAGEGNQKIEVGEARMPLLRKRRLGPQLHQATRSPMSQMFQQALWSRRHGLGRRRSRSRFAQVDDRGWARKKPP